VTSRQFVAIALRLLAIWMAMASIQSVFSMFVIEGAPAPVAYIGYALAYAGVGVFLWTFPMTIAGRILQAAPQDSPMSVTPSGIVHASVIGAGLLLFVDSLPTLLNTVAFAVAIPSEQLSAPAGRVLFIARLVVPVLPIILATVMILRAHQLSRWLRQPIEKVDGDL
jgi:hypothetical protein